ncbi:hypothetical protein [Salinigranum halophilum]|uniref:hypothetical protein n=1 Tax=Salinigranum halophilum TaxID=2565931 RepID=UPI0013754DCC|nr:hypothetical protein [Salinigranum halophilum]
MVEQGENPGAIKAVGRLFIELGTRYETAQNAVEGLSVLLREDETLRDDAVSIWCSIVETVPPVHEQVDGASADADEYPERRAAAMLALAACARKFSAFAPLGVLLARTEDPDPLVRLYASFALASVARREPGRIRPHVERLVSTADSNPNPLGAGVWATPEQSAPSSYLDRLTSAKLFRGVLESILRPDISTAEQWDAVTTVGSRLPGDRHDVCNKLVRLLPPELEFWPSYLALLEGYTTNKDPSIIETCCAQAICYRMEYTCEDWRDGDINWTSAEEMCALKSLRKALKTVSDPNCLRILCRGFADCLRAYAANQFAGDCAWFDVDTKTVHRRLEGDRPLEVSAEVRAELERLLESGRGLAPADQADAETLYLRSITDLFAEIGIIDPSLIRNHIGWIHDAIATAPVTNQDEHKAVIQNCCRTLIHVGSIFPESVESVVPTLRELLNDVINQSQFEVLDSVLGATVVTAGRQSTLLEPFVDLLRGWCLDPPGDPLDLSVGRSMIQYYAVWGLRFDSADETEDVLNDVASDADGPDFVRDAARTVLDRR